jgi:hypothetical protein
MPVSISKRVPIRELRVKFGLSLLVAALFGARMRDDPERREHPSPRPVLARIPSMKLFGCLRTRRVSGYSLPAFAGRFPIGEPIAT